MKQTSPQDESNKKQNNDFHFAGLYNPYISTVSYEVSTFFESMME